MQFRTLSTESLDILAEHTLENSGVKKYEDAVLREEEEDEGRNEE